MTKPPFFIVGVGRSGTTLIRLMMHNHPNIAIPYESHFVTDYSERADEYGSLNEDKNLRRLINDILSEELLTQWDHEFDTDKIIALTKSRTINGVFTAIYEDYANGKDKIRWGDKSDYLDRMHLINKAFPNARFIHIIRDGRDVANSVLKLPWGPKDVISAAEWWHEHVRLGRAMGAMLSADRYMEVRYEDLVQDSEGELRKICDFLDEEYSPEMLNYYKSAKAAIPDERKGQHYNADRPPNAGRVFAWKKEMSPTNIAIFSDYAKASLAAMNYEVPEPTISGFRVKLAKVLVFLKRLF
ncbi:sulfotransferase [Pseudomonadota bacterium]